MEHLKFGEALTAARIKAGMTQPQIAKALGITASTYCGYETGKRSPNPQRIKEIADFIGISVDELFVGDLKTIDNIAQEASWLNVLNQMKRKSGKTLSQISEECGIPQGTLNKIFAGQTRDPQYSTLLSIVHTLGYSLNDLEYMDDEPDVLPKITPDTDIANRLVAVRKLHGITRKQLADELGRPYTTITKYENGEREPSLEYLKEIALKFNVSTDYLLGIEKTATPSRCDSSFYETLVNELASEGHKISETDLRFLEIIFKAITNWFLSAEHFSNENG